MRHDRRYAQLDGLRGIAAGIVLLCHFVLGFQPAFLSGKAGQGALAASTGLAQTPAILFWNPDFPVAVFFVISGFVLWASIPAQPGLSRMATLSGQIARRWVRLTLPILGSSLLIWVVIEAGYLHVRDAAPVTGTDWMAGQYIWLQWFPNSLTLLVKEALLNVYLFQPPRWSGVLWTMPIEFVGSVGIFVAGVLLRGAGRRIRVGACIVATAVLAGTHYGCFAVGAALWELRGVGGRTPRAGAIGGLIALALAFVFGGAPWALTETAYWPAFVVLSGYIDQPLLAAHRLGAVFMVVAALWWPPFRAVLAMRVPQALGRISFMIYLCHTIIMCSAGAWLVVRLTPAWGYDAASLAALIASIALVAVVAPVMTWLWDTPAIRLSRWCEARLGRFLSLQKHRELVLARAP